MKHSWSCTNGKGEVVTESHELHNGTYQLIYLESVNGRYVLEDDIAVSLRCYDCKCSLSQSDKGTFGKLLLIVVGLAFVLVILDYLCVSLYYTCVKKHAAFFVCCQSRRYLH